MTETLSDNQHLETGRIGEEQAVLFLKKRLFTIIDRNYWKKWGEIDIVAKNKPARQPGGGCLHFIEVKTVTRETLGVGKAEDYEPEDNLHHKKRARLKRVIQTYLLDKKVPEEQDWQIDVISVYLNPDGGVTKIDYLEDVIL